MTTIAAKAGVMACDTARWCNGIRVGFPESKIRNHYGLLVGCAGDVHHIARVQRWFQAGQPQDDRPAMQAEDVTVLALDRHGGIWIGDGDLRMTHVDAVFAAIGSGELLAIGAMAAGCDAYEAVRIACQFDSGSREPVFGMTNLEAA